MIQALMLLQMAFSLLTLVATTPVPQEIRDQAIAISNRAIVVANEEIAKSQTPESPYVPVPQYTPPVVISPGATGSIPIEVSPIIQPKKMSTLKIISPIASLGLGKRIDPVTGIDRGYVAYDWNYLNTVNVPDNERPIGFKFPDESNQIYLGLVCGGSRTETVTVEATDATQNKTINGTGAIGEIMSDLGEKSKVFYYPYTYQFKTEGEHTITFTCNGESASVTMTVSNPQ